MKLLYSKVTIYQFLRLHIPQNCLVWLQIYGSINYLSDSRLPIGTLCPLHFYQTSSSTTKPLTSLSYFQYVQIIKCVQ